MSRQLCELCGSEFEAQRSTARYCSDRCRQGAARGRTPSADPLEPPEGWLPAEQVKPAGYTEAGTPYYPPGRFDRDPIFVHRVAELRRTMPVHNARILAARERARTN